MKQKNKIAHLLTQHQRSKKGYTRPNKFKKKGVSCMMHEHFTWEITHTSHIILKEGQPKIILKFLIRRFQCECFLSKYAQLV